MQIELEDVRRSYRIGAATVDALRGVTLGIGRGDYVALTGASGSGKSTLLHLIGCLDQPSSGRYRLDGTPIEDLADDALSRVRNERIGFVFQAFYLIPEMSVLENVEVPLVYRDTPRAERVERAREVLEAVGLASRSDHRPSELSGGERQRTAIARALVGRPEILLADEPTGSLDSATGDEITELLEKHNAGGTTLLIVTHDEARARRASRQIRMRDGRIAA